MYTSCMTLTMYASDFLTLLEAAKTYFTSLMSAHRLRNSGRYGEKCVQQRRRNRLMRVSSV